MEAHAWIGSSLSFSSTRAAICISFAAACVGLLSPDGCITRLEALNLLDLDCSQFTCPKTALASLCSALKHILYTAIACVLTVEHPLDAQIKSCSSRQLSRTRPDLVVASCRETGELWQCTKEARAEDRPTGLLLKALVGRHSSSRRIKKGRGCH
jgi:hypothetical protein